MSKFVFIQNVPRSFSVADLRAHFSEWVERNSVDLFHYVGRPEQEIPKELLDDLARPRHQQSNSAASTAKPSSSIDSEDSDDEAVDRLAKVTFCGIAKVSDPVAFIAHYNEKPWLSLQGTHAAALCFVSPLKDPTALERRASESLAGKKKFLTKRERLQQSLSHSGTKASTFAAGVIPELHPPPGLPQGNVGTPRDLIRQMIRKCLLPTSALKMMGIRGEAALPEHKSESKVNFSYPAPDSDDEFEDNDSHSAEEWERHEAVHGTSDQDEKEELLFEEQVELSWEKGGSGLVFHTDAAYWDSLKGDYDERTANDLDVTDVEPSSAFGPSRRKPLVRKRKRSSEDERPTPSDFGFHHAIDKEAIQAPPIEAHGKSDVGGFEKHTNKFGSKILRSFGWAVGKGLGAEEEGIKHPVIIPPNVGSSGLGYNGDGEPRTLTDHDRQASARVPMFRIGTVYDPIEDLHTYQQSLHSSKRRKRTDNPTTD